MLLQDIKILQQSFLIFQKGTAKMKRIIVKVLKNILFVPYYWIMLNWYAAHVDRYTEEQRYAMLKKIDHAANRG